MSNTRGQQAAERFGDNARKLRELQRHTTKVKTAEAIEEVLRLRQALEAEQALETNGLEGEEIARQFNKSNNL